jgi:hypothetical protein
MNQAEIIKIFYKNGWFKDYRNSSVMMRFYSSHRVNEKLIEQFFGKEFQEGFDDVLVRTGFVADLYYSLSKAFLPSDENGNPQNPILLQVKDLKLPNSNYTILSTPAKIDGKKIGERTIHARLNKIAALLRIMIGSNFLKDVFYEFELDLIDGNMTSHGEIVSLITPDHGPFLNEVNISELKEIYTAVTSCEGTKKELIQLSLDIFERAAKEEREKRFIYYWIAIDILLGKDDNNPFRIFKHIYSSEIKAEALNGNPDFLGNDLGIQFITDIRNNYFHEGKEYPLLDAQERYIHVLYIDLLRHKLELPPQKHLLRYVKNGFNPNNLNTPEQNVLQIRLPKIASKNTT